MNKRDARFFDPYSINIETGETKVVYQNDKNFDSWFTDHAGVIRIASKTDGVNTTFTTGLQRQPRLIHCSQLITKKVLLSSFYFR